jgi:hypothetical protein
MQLEIDFAGGSEAGFNQWHLQRREALLQLARKLGLPISHPVEVWLLDGVRLRGVLRLPEEILFIDDARDPILELVVDGVRFKPAEIQSCVRQD